MTEHTHCWHPVTNTPAGETPYAQQCCWCGAMQYQDGQINAVTHGPYRPAQHTVHMAFDDEINAAMSQSWGRFLKDNLR